MNGPLLVPLHLLASREENVRMPTYHVFCPKPKGGFVYMTSSTWTWQSGSRPVVDKYTCSLNITMYDILEHIGVPKLEELQLTVQQHETQRGEKGNQIGQTCHRHQCSETEASRRKQHRI